jgi:hypothetical protein
MYFAIDLNERPPTVALMDLDNFRAFQIEATGPTEAIPEAIAPYGRWDGDHAWIRPDAVKQAAGSRATQVEWQAGFEAMTTFATEHGYVDGDGSLRAHVDWRP